MFKKIIFPFVIGFLLTFSQNQLVKAQSAELIGGNILNGAVTGSVLGVATMGLRNDSDFTPLRIGIGTGILAGAGLAVYDVATLPQGQQFFISGVFNDGTNSSIIILLDTFYGAALGVALGSAIMLITNDPIVDGIQYGASYGAWAGFGFGLIDSFALAERNRDFVSNRIANRNAMVELSHNNKHLNILEPAIFSFMDLTGETAAYKLQPSLNLFSLKASF